MTRRNWWRARARNVSAVRIGKRDCGSLDDGAGSVAYGAADASGGRRAGRFLHPPTSPWLPMQGLL